MNIILSDIFWYKQQTDMMKTRTVPLCGATRSYIKIEILTGKLRDDQKKHKRGHRSRHYDPPTKTEAFYHDP